MKSKTISIFWLDSFVGNSGGLLIQGLQVIILTISLQKQQTIHDSEGPSHNLLKYTTWLT